ncbi:CPBP family intramembrane metalloprotease [Streptococcus didelphis]|uniref:CPBP family intramembrane glutamic endopeptidase n=1 Tax=Streptococcus didelphis TaxID=102886 RepID=UPI00146131E6|nr:CPBP family intramembrane glutamic endopeptidase [Streptococcus didelphis]WMB29320.1 CPBP family intramembrane metalloprotease [Streptococcus didelphis]
MKNYFFRGLIFSRLEKEYSPLKASLISALLFGLAHSLGLLSDQPSLLILSQIIYAFFMGILFGAVFYVTKNIWSLVFLHGLVDFCSAIIKINTDKNQLEDASTILETAIANLVFVFPAALIGLTIL